MLTLGGSPILFKRGQPLYKGHSGLAGPLIAQLHMQCLHKMTVLNPQQVVNLFQTRLRMWFFFGAHSESYHKHLLFSFFWPQ